METKKLQHFINPDFLRPQLSTKLYRTTYNYLKRFYSENIFDEICAELKVPTSFLLDDDNWVSVEFGRQFSALVRTKTNDDEIYQKIGGFFFDSQNINPIEHQILKTFSPFVFFKVLPQSFKKMNQACELIVRSRGLGSYDVTIRALNGTLYRDMALNSVGVLKGLEEFYKLKNFSIQLQTECAPGAEITEFNMRVEFAASRYFLDIAILAATVIGGGALLGYLVYEWELYAGLKVVPVLTTAFVLTCFWLYRSNKSLNVLKRNIELYYEKSREKNVQLYQKSELLDRRYKEANLLRELSTELVTIKDPQKVLQVCLNSLQAKFAYNQMALFLVSKKRQKLFLSESRGLNQLRAMIGEVEFVFPNPQAKEGFFATILEKGESALIDDIDAYKEVLQERNRQLLELLSVGSFVVSPIQTPTEKYGLLIVFQAKDLPALTEADKFLVEKISNFLALYLDNASNFEKEAGLRKVFQQYVPPIVLEEFIRDGSDGIDAEPKRSEVISVFIDLRDFTSLSEKISPERVVQIISRYADFISGIFSEQGAVIDNIVGDAVVMFFPCSTNPVADLKKLFTALDQLNRRWSELRDSMGQLGLKDFKLGVGAHIGPALVGNVGGSIKRNYTALGDTVNIASRLQTLSKKFPADLGAGDLTVVVSSEILRRLDFKDRGLHSEKLRGRDEVTTFALVDEELLDVVLGRKAVNSRDKAAS